MRLIGFAMVIISSFTFGLNFTLSKKERIANLSSFVYMLEIIKAEITTNLCSVPAAIERAELKVNGIALRFIKLLKINLSVLGEKSFSTIWKESFYACSATVSENESISISALGDVLGRYGVDTQEQALDECIFLLRESEKKAACEFPQFKRLSLGVSVTAGMILGIFLI